MRRTKASLVASLYSITIDFLWLMSAWSTIQLTTLFAQSALYVQVPIQYKGGPFFELYNGKGSHMDMEMYHSIVLADVVGKISARPHRN